MCKNGNSAAVTLPAEWRRREHVQVGDTVEVHYEYDGRLYITAKKKGGNKRRQLFDELMSAVDEVPSVPWEDDSPEADRAILAERYEQ